LINVLKNLADQVKQLAQSNGQFVKTIAEIKNSLSLPQETSALVNSEGKLAGGISATANATVFFSSMEDLPSLIDWAQSSVSAEFFNNVFVGDVSQFVAAQSEFGFSKLFSNLNEWSEIGNDDNPITILSNGFSYEPGDKFHVEKINKDLSTIYLTSTQKLPLQPDRTGNVNPLTNPINPSKYYNAQIIINSDRVTLNSKKDEVMIFAKTNVEISTKNIINLNANERIHLNGGTVFLGTINNQLPSEPLVLGNKTYDLLLDLLGGMYEFGTSLSTVIGSPEGAPAIDINTAAEGLLNTLDRATDRLEGILSQQNFTA